MSDKAEAAPKKKGGILKLLMIGGGLIVLVGGGVGAGLYASSSGLVGGGPGAARDTGPRLVPASEQKRASAAGEGGGHGEGGGESAGGSHGSAPPPGEGGDRYASNYYAMDKEFTANLKESVHFVQVGIAVSTPYDDTVIDNLKTHEIAVRSAVLMELGNTDEETVFTEAGKIGIQKRVAASINRVLKEKSGFGGISNVYFTNFVVQ
ncbi:flagellar basal body-associated FliL family protein [Sphingomonas sp.]|uniref:flagellar basal body-associated FliL family protein n=1 Tax=Sphingomonas sp. TaxID=28214 RepID=UPI002B801386|nr:flagellar basal body-associated FliL family protein [Sphingomonas sp.]HWK36613.1 flagellar basal body-associated FliL family protein [Sphingomonas sp.]